MSKENNIKKGLLSEKMSSYSVEPPEGAWENISSTLGGGNSRRILFIVLAAAAGIALALTVGISMFDRSPEQPFAESGTIDKDIDKAITAESIERDAERIVKETAEKKIEVTDLEVERIPEKAVSNKKPSKLEEKVLIAMEEVIEEMESIKMGEEEVIIAANVEEEQGTMVEEEQANIVEEEQGNTAIDQLVIDSVASENYLDSLAKLAHPDEVIIPDISEEKGRWQIGASLSPTYSYRDASSLDFEQNQAANNSETGLLAYSGGVQFSYHSSKRLTIESGLYYNKMGLAIGDFDAFKSELDFVVGDEIYTDNNIVSLSNSIGSIATTNEDVFVNSWAGSGTDTYNRLESTDMVLQDEVVNSFVQSLAYLEIPFNLKYIVLDRDFKILLIGGISTNLLVGNHVSANTANGKLDYGSVQDIKTVNYSGNAGLGFVYSFTENLNLSLEPRFRYYLNSINNSQLPATRPYVFGVYTGVNYSF